MKKALSLLLVFAMLVSVTGAFAGEYQDTANHWAEGAIDRWTSAGVVSGSKGEFRPDGQMTRAEAAQVFANLLKLTEKADLSGYADVDAGAWYADAMAACVARGIFQGNGKGSMLPTADVSRETFFVMLARGLSITPEKNANHDFADAGSVSSWAEGYVNRGYVQGAGGSLAPAVDINRASVMALLDQTICAYVTEEGAAVAPTENGVVLVVANNVTVSGDFSGDVVVAAEGAKVSLEGATGEVNVNVVADDVAVTDAPVGATIQVGDGVEGATANGAEIAAGEGGVVADGGVVMPEGTEPDPTKPDDGEEEQKPGEEEHIHSYNTPSYSVGEDGKLMVRYECSCTDITSPTAMTESFGLSAASNGLDVHGRIYENGYATFVLPVGEVNASEVNATITAGAYQWVINIATDLTQKPTIEQWLDEVIEFKAATMTITAGDAQAVYSFEKAVKHDDDKGVAKAYTVYATVDDVQPLVDVLEDSANVEITDLTAEDNKFSINLGSELTMGDKILTYAAGVREPIVLNDAAFADGDALSSEIRDKTELKDATTDADLIAHLTAGTILSIGEKQVKLLKDLTITIDNMNGAAGNCTLNQCLVRLQGGSGEYNTAMAVMQMVNDIVACLSGSNATCTIEFTQAQ